MAVVTSVVVAEELYDGSEVISSIIVGVIAAGLGVYAVVVYWWYWAGRSKYSSDRRNQRL